MSTKTSSLQYWTSIVLTVFPLMTASIWFISDLDKRIAIVEQQERYISKEMSGFKSQLLRIGENSEKIYVLLIKKGILND